ncbi:F-box protein CPR1-like [Papaver somniferum]|uniref:F-box protein CPR1-like n=1 Tax=Papaver somniferum TaxID=3469 RepID=UPI000E6F96A8|nr:F-box protein CPR1-like [Papaver somniferum]XP_026431895.1 F-box protein CPR1-like [Papaver somniferum]
MNLPWDILLDILIRLPLKSIVRFRCVNQSWNNQLKCPKFLKARNDYAVEIGRINLMFHNQNDIYTFSYATSLSTCETTCHIEYPDESNEKEIEVLGCCNGLVLLRHVDLMNDASLSCVIILWNPTMNECKRLPNPTTGKQVKDRNYVEYGLGYDEQIEDFKVVRLTQAFYGRWSVCDVYVYTLTENSWRRVDSIPIDGVHYPRITDMGRWPVNGGFHWTAQLERSNFLHRIFLLRFESETEDLDAVPLPAFDENAMVCLCVLGGSLCCFCSGTEVLDVWELKYNGEEEEGSWTELFTVKLREHFGQVSIFMPLKILNNGKLVLGLELADRCLHIVVYDPKHVTFETINVHDESLTSDAFGTTFYEESLFSLGTGIYLGKVHWEASDEEDWIDSSEEDEYWWW